MKAIYYDCFAGISGDMNLGAMVDLGVDQEHLKKELNKLNISGYSLDISRDHRKQIYGTRVIVNTSEHKSAHHHHPHRHLKDIQEILTNSDLSEKVKALSMKMFTKIAEAEAKIHSKSIDEIHFHEVGAVDSIIDIVGAAICIEYLHVEKIVSSTVEIGGGFVTCAHGTFPVPAPATAELLKNIPIKSGAADKETTTPTGAALLAANVNEFTDNCRMRIEKTAYGIGGRDLDIPNVLRVHIGEWIDSNYDDDTNDIMIETTIDDMNPEIYDHIMGQLLENGADEVYITPVLMKKNRPGNMISVLCKKEKANHLTELLLMESSTLGVRQYDVYKTVLDRKIKEVNTSIGTVKIKYAWLNGKQIKSKPEYEDCKAIAKDKNIPLNEVYRIIDREQNKG